MNARSIRWWWVLLPAVLGVWLFWPPSRRQVVRPAIAPGVVQAKPAAVKPGAGLSAPAMPVPGAGSNLVAAVTNKFPYRLTNTHKSLGELSHDSRAILLENALIDTRATLDLTIPKSLQSEGDPGAYIVQADGPIDARFRAMLAADGVQIVSYIPNAAYLVEGNAGQASAMASSGLAAAVLPYEPYYKVSSGLLAAATAGQALPAGQVLNLGVFASAAPAVEAQLESLDVPVLAEDRSPFGPILRVYAPTNWTALAQLPGVQRVEAVQQRRTANDLARVALGVSVDTVTNVNYLNLYGSNVMVEVNDSGIDSTHPDFTLGGTAANGPSGPTRVLGDSAGSLTDANGHGTHVAGIIAGNGAESYTLTNIPSGSVTNADFRGKAPLASLYSVGFMYSVAGLGAAGPGPGYNNGDWEGGNDLFYGLATASSTPDIYDVSDYYLQTIPAQTNALISNNSWTYGGDNDYDLAAASYDAAVRDALPMVTGSQPVLFVFAAGNGGGGNDDGSGGNPDTIESPGTAKNVITVGALEQFRDITNTITDADGNTNDPYWQPWTDSDNQVTSYSARGNVGVGVEGDFGRFKPDVVAPGTFVVSTRTSTWDQYAYYTPTNFDSATYPDQVVPTNGLNYYNITVPGNAVGVVIQVYANSQSATPFPTNLPIYAELNPEIVDFATYNGTLNIPQDTGSAYLQSLLNNGVYFAVGNTNDIPINYDLTLTVIVTNNNGTLFQVLSNLNDTLAPYYRYESGTSMSAASASGVLALMQDFFTNRLGQVPSPALLKAMLINGAQSVGNYQIAVTNPPNSQGWGLVNLPGSIPSGLTNLLSHPTNTPMFFQDQSPANALATGDSQTFQVTVSPGAVALPMRVTLVWTDPPGDPAAAFKLVNNLDIVVTNVASGDVYYGNNFSSSGNQNYSYPVATNATPNLDVVNNVRNIYLQEPLATNYTVTVVGRSVNMNAVTAQSNNVVQDFALVISAGDGTVSNGVNVVASPTVTNPTGDQDITFVITTNQPLLNQIAGENSPLLGTNTVAVGTNSPLATNGVVTIGQTNQWHFYVVRNNFGQNYTNAAFITFNPLTMALPTMGTLADTVADATRPEGDIDLYVSSESGLTNLDPVVISNCVNGVNVGNTFNDAVSAGPGGTEFVAYSNSSPGQVYYVGIKSEDHLGTVYGFLPVFSAYPFSQMNSDGSESVNGLTLPVPIPAGSPVHPQTALIFALALYPLTIDEVIVTNGIIHTNFGNLFGQLSHDNITDVLNNHDAYGIVNSNFLYYDAPANPINTPIGSVNVPTTAQPSDGPGSLISYRTQSAIGPWILAEVANAYVQAGSNMVFGLRIYPHNPANKGLHVYIAGKSAYYDYIDVPAGVTNMTLSVTNETVPVTVPELEVFLRFGADPSPEPNPTIYDETGTCTNGTPPGCTLSVGPSSIPPIQPGRYYYEIYNPSGSPATNVYIITTFQYAAVSGGAVFTSATVPAALPSDAVMTNSITITNTETIFSAAVGVVVDSPRVSDLTLTLVSPTRARYVLFEQRGGDYATNLGHLNITTNSFGNVQSGGPLANTNSFGPVPTQGTLLVDYNMYTVPDDLVVYYDGVEIFDSGEVSLTGEFAIPYGPGTSTNLTIIMNPGNNPTPSDEWTYTPFVVSENATYLTFSSDTNLAPVPIKFAIPPFDLTDLGTNYTLSDFEPTTNGDYVAPTNIYDPRGGWNLYGLQTNVTVSSTNSAVLLTNIIVLTNNEVSVITDPANSYNGSNFLALATGTITRMIPTEPNRQYSVEYSYRGPGIAGWWRGEGNATDSSDPETNGNNGLLIGRFTFPAGEVGQAFEMAAQGELYDFAGTNNYVQVPQAPGLDVGTGSGFTVEGWINPTNLFTQEPLVEWLAHMPTNTAVTNIEILAGPFLYRGTGHYYYLLGETNWTTSEQWATNMGGHLVTVSTADLQNWVYDAFADYAGTNRNLWIGLNDAAHPGSNVWSSGETNVTYSNWEAGQPTNACGSDYTVILGPTNSLPGLWRMQDNNGNTCTILNQHGAYGVAELDTIPTNGVQLWVSVTNSPATGQGILSSNGCLYANLVDTTNGYHEIWSAPGLIQSNLYQHVALTYDTNTGVARLYYQGTNVCSTNLGIFTPKTTGDVLLGKDMSLLTNNYFSGEMDEMSVYRRRLSDAEILAIYQISALSTNNLITNGIASTPGKFDPAFSPSIGLAEAVVSLGGRTNRIFGGNTNWQRMVYTFIATSNSMPLQITGLEPGMLLDDFTVSESQLGNLYYQPEQPLDPLVGEVAAGVWTLEIQNNRAGDTNFPAQLVSWQLDLQLQTNNSVPITLGAQTPAGNTVPPGQTAYFFVPVPSWATSATNILVSASGPVDLLYNPTNLPTGANPGGITLLTDSTSGIGQPILTANSAPSLPVGLTNFYYLGVSNVSSIPVSFVVRVDFNITALSNSVPLTGTLTTNDAVRYFSFEVSTNNAWEATFQLLQLSGSADLVLNYGTPLPNLTNAEYGSFNVSNVDQSLYVLTNSLPVPLAPGTWYLGVFRNQLGPVTYTVLAKELDMGATQADYTVIPLTNNVPFNFTAGPGAALTNFFSFFVTNSPAQVHFALYNLTGNGDLILQSNVPPLYPPWYQSSQEPGELPEYIYLRTNSVLTNLTATWYLGVPNNETNLIHFTILAVIDTNLLASFPGAVGAGGYTAGGRGSTNVYHVINLNDDGPGSLRYGVNTLTNHAMIVFDVSGNIPLLSPLVITNSFLTIAGQTAPGDGITLQNYPTLLSGAHDVILRYLRFRPGYSSTNIVSAQFFDDFNGPTLNPLWVPDLPNNAHSGSNLGSDTETYNGAPSSYGFAKLGSASILGLTNSLDVLHRVGWCTATNFADSSFYYDVRFNTLTQSGTTSIDAFIEIWILDATNSSRYDIISPFGGDFDGSPYFFVGSSIDGTYQTSSFTYANNTWYHLVLQCGPGGNIQASICNDNGTTLAGPVRLNHGTSAFPNGFRLGLSQAVGQTSNQNYYKEAVAVDYARLNISTNAVPNPTPGDSLAFTNAANIVIDHVSASWSTNAIVEVLDSTNITVEWSVIADSLCNFTNTTPPQGGPATRKTNGQAGQGSLLRYGNGSLSFYHNLYADNYSSSPELGENLTLDFVNNVIYNWGLLPGWSTNELVNGQYGFTNELNYACNYLIATTNSQTNYIAFWSATNTWIFQTNNFIDTNTSYVFESPLAGAPTGWAMFTNLYTPFGQPFVLPFPPAPNATLPTADAEPAYQAYEDVLDFAGSQLSRDRVDQQLIWNVRNQTNVQFIASQTNSGGWPLLRSRQQPLDTDQDGMPDYWEITFGLNPTNALDGTNIVAATGYTELETYLNWLAGPHALTVGTNPVGVDLYQLAGRTGRLSFSVANALNGSVVLTNEVYTNAVYTNGVFETSQVVTWTNTLAVFTPSNNYTSSFTNPASFDFYVTNDDTVAWFGPVTVSVVVSATNIILSPAIIDLTNGVPYTLTNAGPVAAFTNLFRFTPTNSPGGVVFELYAITNGSANLVVQTNGLPVPPDYFLATAPSANSQLILVQTNAALTNINSTILGNLNEQWYLGVINDNPNTNAIAYTILAEELPAAPNIITLTNNVPYAFTAGPGPDLTNFFVFPVSDSPNNVEFHLYNLTGNGGLTVETNALPFAPLFNWSSPAGNNPQLIQVGTNGGMPSLNANWFLGVTNRDPAPINYTILAQEFTNTPAPVVIATNSPVTNTIASGVTAYYQINVPANAVLATNALLSATGPLSVWYSTNVPPTLGNTNDAELLAGVTSGTNVFGTNVTAQLIGSTLLVPGGLYYLAVNNNNAIPVTYVLDVNFQLVLPTILAPVITNLLAANVTAFGATLEASVIPNGTNTTVYFEYGLANDETTPSTTVLLTNSLYSTWPVAIGITGLLPGNLYYYEGIATNAIGAATNGLNGAFVTPVAPPSVATEAATNVTSTNVTLEALVNPNGTNTLVYFAYGTNTSYGSYSPTNALTTGLNTAQWVATNVTGLQPGAIYHFRAIGANSAGTAYGRDLTFTNPAAAPIVTTVATTNYTATSATLLAMVNPNGAATTVWFAYGAATNNGLFSGLVQLNNNLTTSQFAAVTISNLLPGVTYYFQAIGTNSAGAASGLETNFTTLPAIPSVTTLAAANVSVTNATLSAQVTPNGAAATVYFEWGTTTNYDDLTATTPLSSNLITPQFVTNWVTGLLAGVTYHYQAVAYNSAGTNLGGDMTFFVPAPPVSFTSILATNNGYLLSWLASTNAQFKLQWIASLTVTNWYTFTNLITWTSGVTTLTNPAVGLFTFFDNGAQGGAFGPARFYRLTQLPPANSVPPVLPASGSVYAVNPLVTLVVTNTATDANPYAILTYTVTGSLVETNPPVIGTNTGIITWTPTLAQAGLTNLITTIVTDNGQIPLSSTNSFTVLVNPIPVFTSVQIGEAGVTLQWLAAASNEFQVGWTTNLLLPWTYVPANPPYLSSVYTNYYYVDTNSLNGMKFYRLLQLP